MSQADKQFGGFLRMLIARMKKVVEALKAGNQNDALEMMQDILNDLQSTLED